MHRPLILNFRLNQLYKSEQDRLMAQKLAKIKASVKSNCPESFIFFNSHFHRPTPKFSICKFININLYL